AVVGLLVDQGTNQIIVLRRITDGERFISPNELVDQFIGDRFVHDQTAHGGAPLTCRTCCCKRDAAQSQVKVSRRSDNSCVVAAQFKEVPAKPRSDNRCDLLAHPGGAGCRDELDAWVFQDWSGSVGIGEYNVVNTGWCARVSNSTG